MKLAGFLIVAKSCVANCVCVGVKTRKRDRLNSEILLIVFILHWE